MVLKRAKIKKTKRRHMENPRLDEGDLLLPRRGGAKKKRELETKEKGEHHDSQVELKKKLLISLF
jgi:hypothetical protein